LEIGVRDVHMTGDVATLSPPVIPTVRSSVALASAAIIFTGAGCSKDPAIPALSVARQSEATLAPGQIPMIPAHGANLTQPPAALPPMPVSLAIPSVTRGELASGDFAVPEDSGRVADQYFVQLTAGVPVTFIARGGTEPSSGASIDLMLMLYRNRDDSAASGGAMNPRIVFSPSETGLYVLRVTSYGGNFRAGPYTLQTYSGAQYSVQ
jgi:hypothetical protein